jgi:hypothetical protein
MDNELIRIDCRLSICRNRRRLTNFPARSRVRDVGSGLRMARVISLDAFRKQPLAAPLAPAGKDRAPGFGFHPGTKTMLTFACSLGGLVSPFHKTAKAKVGWRAVTLGMSTALSIGRVRSRCDGSIRGLPAPPIFEISGFYK